MCETCAKVMYGVMTIVLRINLLGLRVRDRGP